MSRIGKNLIEIPDNTEVSIEPDSVTVKCSGKENTCRIEKGVMVESVEEGKALKVTVDEEFLGRDSSARWGMYASIIRNLVEGVTKGFKKELEINGVGYRFEKKGDAVMIYAGYSHPFMYRPPEGIEMKIEGNRLTVEGIDKQCVGQVAAEIRGIRKPEPYGGKGIKYVDEHIIRKAGKTAA